MLGCIVYKAHKGTGNMSTVAGDFSNTYEQTS